MNSSLVSLITLVFLLAGCGAEKQPHLPLLVGTNEDGQQKSACAAIFPQGKWQLVHAIEFTMKDGAGPPLVGVTTIDDQTIGCALVTVEGLTLFEAVYNGAENTVVRRALPPFDKPEFAGGLIGDIRAIFQPPDGSLSTGQLPGTRTVCRYREADGGVTDIELTADDCWQRRGYSSDFLLQRSIIGRSCRKNGSDLLPAYLNLKTYGRNGYTLNMTLISADRIP